MLEGIFSLSSSSIWVPSLLGLLRWMPSLWLRV